MPVLVTGAARAVGMATVRGLLRARGEVRAWVDDEAAADEAAAWLRAAGCKVARGTIDDEGRLELALEQVHTVVHLAGTVLDQPDALVDDVASVLSAALGAGVRRLVWTSHIGADDPRGNPWLEACAEAEALIRDAPLETVVIQCALAYGPHDLLTEVLAESTAGASPEALHAPLYIEDLAAAIVAADARDRAAVIPHLALPLGGPEIVNLGELVALLGGQVIEPTADSPLPWHAVDVLSRDLVAPRDAASAGTSPRAGAAAVRRDLGLELPE